MQPYKKAPMIISVQFGHLERECSWWPQPHPKSLLHRAAIEQKDKAFNHKALPFAPFPCSTWYANQKRARENTALITVCQLKERENTALIVVMTDKREKHSLCIGTKLTASCPITLV
jgi:hypothetical protein